MTTTYLFQVAYKKLGIATAPSDTPTIDIINLADGSLVVNDGNTTKQANMPGLCTYSYAGAAGLNLIGLVHSTDTTVDEQDLHCIGVLALSQTDLVDAPNPTAITAIQSGLATPASIWAALTSGLTTPGSIGKWIVDKLDVIVGTRQTLGAGAISTPITVKDGIVPLEGVDVWTTTDLAGSNLVSRGFTDTAGLVTFMLDTGTYYLWMQKAGYTFTNPTTLTV